MAFLGERVTDSAGVTCVYTPIEQLKPGDVVIIGWRATVKRIEFSHTAMSVRVVWEWGPPADESVDRWNPIGTLLPREELDD